MCRDEISDKVHDVISLKENLLKEEDEKPSTDLNKDCVTEEKVAMSSEGLQSSIKENDYGENNAPNKLRGNRMATNGSNRVPADHDTRALRFYIFAIFILSLVQLSQVFWF